MTNAKILIHKGREKPILNKHPWVFSGAISETRGNPTPGDIVTVESHTGGFLARGYWNPKSQIQVRLLTWQDESIDDEWWRRMLARAIEAREKRMMHTLYRVVHAESDYLPGLIIDRYGEWLVLQALTLGIDRRKQMIAEIAAELMQPLGVRAVFERSDVDVRKKEGLRDSVGALVGDEPPELLTCKFGFYPHLINLRAGHKTGVYIDQKENYGLVQSYVMYDYDRRGIPVRILNLFSYTGNFGMLPEYNKGITHVTNVDSSRDALELAEQIYQHNRFPDDYAEFIQGDVFDFIRDQVAAGEQYDVVICDPPKFAHNAGQVERAARGYKDLNLHSFKLVKPGGLLATFSCSGAISRDLFQKIAFGALADSGRDAQILRLLSAGEDHPIALTFPEGEYLKGLLLRVY